MGSEDTLLIMEYNLARVDYTRKICTGCMNTQQQIDRKCRALQGFRKPSCDQMHNALERRKSVKIAHKKALDNLMKGFTEMVERRQKERNSQFS